MGILSTATETLSNQFSETLTNVSIKQEATENLSNTYSDTQKKSGYLVLYY